MIRDKGFTPRKKRDEIISPPLQYVPVDALHLSYYGKTDSSQLWLKASCGLVIEMDLLFTTYGGIQRVSSCCFAPAQKETWDPDIKPVCTCCGATTGFTSHLFSLVTANGHRNEYLTHELTEWLENCFPCLEDQLVALTVQEEMENIFTQVIGRRHEYSALNSLNERRMAGYKLLSSLIPNIITRS